MDVRSRNAEAKRPVGTRAEAFALRPRGLPAERIGEVLGEWQAREVRVAHGFAQCRGLSTEQLEDLYQETALALLRGRFQSEEHLRNALRQGLKNRALNLHRDERGRTRILARNAPGMQLTAQARDAQNAPEGAALGRQDRLLVSEFLTELTAVEQRVFWLIAEGLRYRAIAPMLGIAMNDARKVARSCERKRERFQLLYDTGRLCGFRSTTIRALHAGESTSEELAVRAFAHLEGCAHCRAEHKTNAKRLRRSFQDQAAALLPLPAFTGHLTWLTRLDARARGIQHRLHLDRVPFAQGAVRERTATLLAGGGVSAKVAAGVLSVAVIAGGTIGATHVLEHPRAQHPHRATPDDRAAPPVTASRVGLAPAPLAPIGSVGGVSVRRAAPTSKRARRSSPGHVISLSLIHISEPTRQAEISYA